MTVASSDIEVSYKMGEISDLAELAFSVLKNRNNTIEEKDSGVCRHEKIEVGSTPKTTLKKNPYM